MVKKQAVATLPEGIVESDKSYPSGKGKDKADNQMGDYGILRFYRVESPRGDFWCLCTLPIGGRSGQFAPRTYAMKLDDEPSNISVGGGPHVKEILTIHCRKGNKVHKKYHDLYIEGCGRAGVRRDRISSRRIEGAERRARGEYSWFWKN